jgi:thiol-disulfide isomerase/thioredoxin
MSTKTVLTLIIFLTLFNARAQNYHVRIDGQIIGYDGVSEVRYTLSPSNLSYQYDTVKPDSSGRFTIYKIINGTQFFSLICNTKDLHHTCKLIVQPGHDYSFVSKGEKQSDWWAHYSPDIYSWRKNDLESGTFYSIDFGQMYYNRIDNGTMGLLYDEDWNLSEPETLIDTLQSRINKMDQIFSGLLKKGKIDREFYEIAMMNARYLQAYRLAVTISGTWQVSHRYSISSDPAIVNKLHEVYPKIFELYPVKGIKIEQVYLFDKYVDLYLAFLADSKDGTFKPQTRKGPAYLKVLENSRDVLTPEAYKNYKMGHTMSFAASLDLRSAKQAKEYLEEYPEMKNTGAGAFLNDVLIPRAEDFIKLSDEKLPEGSFILDDDKPVKSFRELLDHLDGKPFLVDYWGTWCGPCKYQFKFNDPLKSFLKENGIAMVYIAYEYDLNREQWKNFIKAFELTGHHLISNEDFKSDFEKIAGKITGFPSYLIFNSQGELLEPKAYRPSDGKKLINQLKEILNIEN